MFLNEIRDLIQFFKKTNYSKPIKHKQKKTVILKYEKDRIKYIRTDPYYLYNPKSDEERLRKWLVGFSKDWYIVSTNYFFNVIDSKKKFHLDFDFTGVYLIHNLTLNKYYAGQSLHVLKRVNDHFNGKGNPDLFFDYRIGNVFSIETISLTESKYLSLNALERDVINKYGCFNHGYNKKLGNKI